MCDIIIVTVCVSVFLVLHSNNLRFGLSLCIDIIDYVVHNISLKVVIVDCVRDV